ncbi:MAG: hypothetical protein ACPGYX_03935 [Oceanobacter sp.]
MRLTDTETTNAQAVKGNTNCEETRLESQNAEQISENSRRKFLKKLGQYAAVTPPTVAALMTHQNATASSMSSRYSDPEDCDDQYRSSFRDRWGSLLKR